jgi:hypothetical protein
VLPAQKAAVEGAAAGSVANRTTDGGLSEQDMTEEALAAGEGVDLVGVEESGGTHWEACGLGYLVEGWKGATQQVRASIAAAAARRIDLG